MSETPPVDKLFQHAARMQKAYKEALSDFEE